MSNIEPTEEQKQAARWLYDRPFGIPDIARLLAEREAKLREEVARLEALCTEEARLIVERDTLRARVAELEAERKKRRDAHASQMQNLRADNDRLYLLEAQHLADIKALRRQLDLSDDVVREYASGYTELLRENTSVLDDTAHYDDAKADAGAVCTHSARAWNVIDQTIRCRVCDDAKAAEGGEG